MKSLATHMKESFNQTNENIIDIVTTTSDKEEVEETDTSTKEEPAD